MCIKTEVGDTCTSKTASYGVKETIKIQPSNLESTLSVQLIFNEHVAQVADFKILYTEGNSNGAKIYTMTYS